MDRRDFLKVGGAAAVTAGGAGAATAQSAPAILPGATELRLASPDLPDVPGFGPDRLARRIELATGGRYRITATADASAADLVFGNVNRQRDRHPAFAFFAGLPLGSGSRCGEATRPGSPSAAARCCGTTWPASSGSSRWWQATPDQAAASGPPAAWKPSSDLTGARMHVDGLAADVVRALGATPVHLAIDDLRAGWPRAASTRPSCWRRWFWRRPTCSRWPSASTAPASMLAAPLLSLDVRREVWDRLGAADQAIFEACAAEAYARRWSRRGPRDDGRPARHDGQVAGQLRARSRELPHGPRADGRRGPRRRWPDTTSMRGASTTAIRPSGPCWATPDRLILPQPDAGMT